VIHGLGDTKDLTIAEPALVILDSVLAYSICISLNIFEEQIDGIPSGVTILALLAAVLGFIISRIDRKLVLQNT
jgi:hypothetical protein